MTTFKNKVNAFGNSAGDDMDKHVTKYKGRGVFPKGNPGKYPHGVGDVSSGNRRLSKSKYGSGSGGHPFKGTNAFSKGGKGK